MCPPPPLSLPPLPPLPSPSSPPPPPLPPGVISNWTNESRIPPCTISLAFQYFLDITTPPSPALLQQFAALATSDKHRRRLEVLSKVSKLKLTFKRPLDGSCAELLQVHM